MHRGCPGHDSWPRLRRAIDPGRARHRSDRRRAVRGGGDVGGDHRRAGADRSSRCRDRRHPARPSAQPDPGGAASRRLRGARRAASRWPSLRSAAVGLHGISVGPRPLQPARGGPAGAGPRPGRPADHPRRRHHDAGGRAADGRRPDRGGPVDGAGAGHPADVDRRRSRGRPHPAGLVFLGALDHRPPGGGADREGSPPPARVHRRRLPRAAHAALGDRGQTCLALRGEPPRRSGTRRAFTNVDRKASACGTWWTTCSGWPGSTPRGAAPPGPVDLGAGRPRRWSASGPRRGQEPRLDLRAAGYRRSFSRQPRSGWTGCWASCSTTPASTPRTADGARARGDRRPAVRAHRRGLGPGIPPAQRDQIFDRFHRATGAAPGAGLGLAIADAIVQATGGRWRIGDSPLGAPRWASPGPPGSPPRPRLPALRPLPRPICPERWHLARLRRA